VSLKLTSAQLSGATRSLSERQYSTVGQPRMGEPQAFVMTEKAGMSSLWSAAQMRAKVQRFSGC